MIDTIRYFVIDVDGTMTDSGIYYDDSGKEVKKFSTRDAAAFFALRTLGIKTIVITGRECPATIKRLSELHVDFIFQGVKDKFTFLKQFMQENIITQNMLGYIGDDLNDYSAMGLAGFKACPYDSCSEIIDVVDYRSDIEGGKGAVRDIIEYYLRKIGKWNQAIRKAYDIGS